MKQKTQSRRGSLVRILIAIVYIVFIFIPLIRMLVNIDGESIHKVVTSSGLAEAVRNSLTATLIATVVTILMAFLLAFCVERSRIRCKSIFGVLFVLPMLIPSISNGMGLVILFGNNGFLAKMLGCEFHIYGLRGIVLGSVLYAFPVAYLMLSDVMKYEDSSPYEAATVLGIGKVRQFFAISLPYFRKPLISIVFSVFTLIITDYGVPLMVGGKYTTIPVVLYQEVIGQLHFGKGAVYGCMLLIPAVAAFIIDLTNKDKGNQGYGARPFARSGGAVQLVLSYLCCILVSVFVLLPVLSFLITGFAADYPTDMTFTFANFTKAVNLHADRYLGNSVLIALVVSVVGVGIAFMTAYMTARMKSRNSAFLHLAAITSAAIPGIVLGLSYALVFKGTFFYGTILILVMVNTVHFIASPYLMAYNSLSKLNENLEGVGLTLGIGRARMVKDVFIPQCRETLLEMFAYFFVNCMITISAVSFLSTTANKPVSLMINQFEAQMQLECAAIVSLVILGVNLLLKGIIYLLKSRRLVRRKSVIGKLGERAI